MPNQPSTPTPASVQGIRLLGHAIAFAAVTGLLAYGCEKSARQNQSALHANGGQPKPATPQQAKEPVKDPGTQAAKPVEIGANMVQGEKPAPSSEPDPNAPPAPPKPKPIPHVDLAQDAKPLSEYTTPTRVVVQEFKAGQGMPTLPKAFVTIHFVLHVKDGWKKIQSTYEDGEPEPDTLDEIMAGLADGIVGMQPGATRRIIIPPERGLGAKGAKDKDGAFVIPPDATLVFDVDLVSNKQTIVESGPHKAVAPKFSGVRKDEGTPGK